MLPLVDFIIYIRFMKVGKKSYKKSEPAPLENDINKLVRGLKRDLKKKYGTVDYAKLHRDGYSDFLLIKLRKV